MKYYYAEKHKTQTNQFRTPLFLFPNKKDYQISIHKNQLGKDEDMDIKAVDMERHINIPNQLKVIDKIKMYSNLVEKLNSC